MIVQTPKPPYYAVIFTSIRRKDDGEAYGKMAALMDELAKEQPGYLGMESARNEVGITVSYWASQEAILAWKAQVQHAAAQRIGRQDWYAEYFVRICLVERDYGFGI